MPGDSITKAILESGYHTPSARSCSSSTTLPAENPPLFMGKEGTLGTLRLELSSDKVVLGSRNTFAKNRNQEKREQDSGGQQVYQEVRNLEKKKSK